VEPQHVEGCFEGRSLIIIPSAFPCKTTPVPAGKLNWLVKKREQAVRLIKEKEEKYAMISLASAPW